MGLEIQKRECANCGNEFETHFCPNCGERRLTDKDYSAFSLVNDFVVDVFNIENKFWRTLRTFLIKPSKYVDEYIKGARKKYISPIKLFLIANAWYFLFPAMDTFKSTWNTQLNRLPYSDITNSFLVRFQVNSGLSFAEFEGLYNEATLVISKLFLILQPLILGIITYLLFFSKSREKPIIHHFNHSLTIYAFLLLFGTSILPATYKIIENIFQFQVMDEWLNEFNITLAIFVLLNGFGYLLYRKFFAENWYQVTWKVLVLNLMFIPILHIYRFLLLWITLGWIWLTV